MPMPGGPLTITTRPAALGHVGQRLAERRSARRFARSARRRPRPGAGSAWTISCSRSSNASRLGCTPSSLRRARSIRSNWRRAAWRSPRRAWRRISSRWARSSPGSSSTTSSQRSASRSSSRWRARSDAAPGVGPLLVDVLRQQLAAVAGHAPARPRSRSFGGERGAGELFERHHVDVDVGARGTGGRRRPAGRRRPSDPSPCGRSGRPCAASAPPPRASPPATAGRGPARGAGCGRGRGPGS